MDHSDAERVGLPPGRDFGEPPTTLVAPQTLRARVGQLILTGFRGMTAAEAAPVIEAIRIGDVGGVLLYGIDAQTGEPKNVRNREQLRALVGELQAAAPLPLTVAVDAEGGGFHQQLRPEHGFPPMPAPRELGDRGDVSVTRETARAMARALADVGITLNLAPCVDLALPGNLVIAARRRAFSSDPEPVAAHAVAWVEAHHAAGVACVLKHFPGMGSALSETEYGAPDITAGWSSREMEPYRTLIAAGAADAVMIGHVFHRTLDPETTTTMSRRVVTDLLRGELGFEGVALSDAIEMLAIWDVYGFERALVGAVNAGIDMLLLANPSFDVPYAERRAGDAVDHLVAAVERGEIPEERIDEACERVLRFKERQLALRAAARE